MKKVKSYHILFAVSALLFFIFLIFSGIETYLYCTRFRGSAPLSVYILIRAVEFVPIALILLVIGICLLVRGKRNHKKTKT
jgi:uncharacterized integral membrane protein